VISILNQGNIKSESTRESKKLEFKSIKI